MEDVADLKQVSQTTDPFVSSLISSQSSTSRDHPNYYSPNPSSLVSTSHIHNFITGTGYQIYSRLEDLHAENIEYELILVTCFWARSATQKHLHELLRNLSHKAVRRGQNKIRVRICFSSSSLFQKLFHPSSVEGKVWHPSAWSPKFGLPEPKELGGLELQVKSIFLRPFSVMHPKFMIIDRQRVVLPSCNVSWEDWFEGAVTLSGAIVSHFLRFHAEFWEVGDPFGQDVIKNLRQGQMGADKRPQKCIHPNVPTIFLPSPHHQNPRFQPFASQNKTTAPPTPLNNFLLSAFERAEKSIRIHTPNLTAPPVLSALLRALVRGVDVKIFTSKSMMVVEQLVTAGTTTRRCVRKLIRRYKRFLDAEKSRDLASNQQSTVDDMEAARSTPIHNEQSTIGRLEILYFQPATPNPQYRDENQYESAFTASPTHPHFKATIIDEEIVVLGSGNMDRASWFTSQELGVAFLSRGFANEVVQIVDREVGIRGELAK